MCAPYQNSKLLYEFSSNTSYCEISQKHVMRVSKSRRVKETGRLARMGETGNIDHKFSWIIWTEENNLKTFFVFGSLSETNPRRIHGD